MSLFPQNFLTASREEFARPLTITDGNDQPAKLPEDLRGHVFIIGFVGTVGSPKVKKPDGTEDPLVVKCCGDGTAAIFNGDGMIYRLDFDGSGTALLKTKMVKTPSFCADEITHNNNNNDKYKDLRFHDLGIMRMSSVLGISNQINTALIPIKFKEENSYRLLATNDVNRPYEIDPVTLQIISPFGENSFWKTIEPEFLPPIDINIASPFTGAFRFLISSAHPSFDYNTGEFFSLNVVKSLKNLVDLPDSVDALSGFISAISDKPANEVYLVRSDRYGSFQRWRVTDQGGKSIVIRQSNHMLGVTENYIIFADTAMKTGQIHAAIIDLFSNLLGFLKFVKLTSEERDTTSEYLTEKIGKERQKFLTHMDLQRTLFHPEDPIEVFNKLIVENYREILPELESLLKSLYKEEEILPELESLISLIDKEEEILPELESLINSIFEGAENLFEDIAKLFLQEILKHLKSIEVILDPEKWSSFFRLLFFQFLNNNVLLDQVILQVSLFFSHQQSPDTKVYIVPRKDLLEDTNPVKATELTIKNSPFVHFFTEFHETPNQEILIVAPMTHAFDPAEYITIYDRDHFGDFSAPTFDAKRNAGMIPSGMDISIPSVIIIDPSKIPITSDTSETEKTLPYQPPQYQPKIQDCIDNLFFLGLYAYRDDQKLENIYWVAGGAWPDTLTEFIYRLYQNYPPRHIDFEKFVARVQAGVPMRLCHMKINREQLFSSDENKRKSSVTLDPPDLIYTFPENYIVFALQFVPRTDAQGVESKGSDQGYLICTVVHPDLEKQSWSTESEIWIFDAANVTQGPLYKMSHPKLNFGMTLHSTWLAEIQSPKSSGYDVEKDYEAWVEDLANKHSDQPIRELFEEIYTSFRAYQQGT